MVMTVTACSRWRLCSGRRESERALQAQKATRVMLLQAEPTVTVAANSKQNVEPVRSHNSCRRFELLVTHSTTSLDIPHPAYARANNNIV